MTVGYDRSWRAPEDCLIATLTIGFADGYPRSLSNQGTVGLRGVTYPIAGKARVLYNVCSTRVGPRP